MPLGNNVPSDGVLAALAAIVASLFVAIWRGRTVAQPVTISSPVLCEASETNDDAPSSSLLPHVVIPTPIIRFFFGSQTGCAAGLAKQLVRAAASHNLSAEVSDLAEFSPFGEGGEERAAAARVRLATPGICVFLVASYGDGDPTDNARDFFAWVRDAPASLLPTLGGLRFTVFGLGNRQYEHYNRTGKTLDATLEVCGAKRVFMYGEGDDDANLDDEFESWISSGLWDSLRSAVSDVVHELGGVQHTVTTTTTTNSVTVMAKGAPAPLDWLLVPLTSRSAKSLTPSELEAAGSNADVTSRHLFLAQPARVIENRELRMRPDVGASTRHIVLDLSNGSTPYSTADNLYVCAENTSNIVNVFSAALELDLDSWFRLEPNTTATTTTRSTTLSPLFPTPCTVRTALARYLDLSGAPRKDLLAALSPYATSPTECARLAYLASPEGRTDFAATITETQVSIFELVTLFPSLRPPLNVLVQLLPRLSPRAYTIASSSIVHPHHAAICVSVLDVEKKGSVGGGSGGSSDGNRRMAGVASNFLSQATVGSLVHCYVRASTFKLPIDKSRPLILIGPGTGIAPMRAFIHERAAVVSTGGGVKSGPTFLFFGCRRHDEDYIYRDELELAKHEGTLDELVLAFSRQDVTTKVYVQHRIQEHGERLWELISRENACIYVCGATKMGTDVWAAFEKVREWCCFEMFYFVRTNKMIPPPHTPSPQISRRHGNLSSVEATHFLRGRQSAGSYVQELWSSSS